MKKLIQKISDFVIVYEKISRLEIDKPLKRKIRITWLKVFFFKLFNAKKKLVNIVGFKVKYLDFWMLSYLYNEIFLNCDYSFVQKKDAPVIIDCGSNIGMTILFFKMLYPNAIIEGFEPEKETFLCLQENIKNNSLKDVKLHKVALSNKEGKIDFFSDPETPGSLIMSTMKERMPKEKQSVNAKLLSSFITQEIDFMKMDIEGGEFDVIEELINAGKFNYIKQMVIEYHHHIIEDSDEFSKMISLIEDAGYGYQIEGKTDRPLKEKQFQDILIFAYKKEIA